MIKTAKWKMFNLSKIFTVEYGNKFDLYKMQESDNSEIAFVSRTATNNGISAYVEKLEDVEPYSSGFLTVALGGSIGATFVQTQSFYTGQNVAVLIPKIEISHLAKLFMATIIQKESNIRFVAFGRELNKHIKKDFTLKLPQTSKGEPDYDFMHKYMESFSLTSPKTENIILTEPKDINSWQSFSIDQIFTKFETGRAKSTIVDEGEDCVYLGAKKRDNGIMKKCAYNPDLAHEGNCIVFICNGEGSVGYCNYMDRSFIATTDLEIGYTDKLNKYTGLFLVSVLDKERPKYSFGRKWRPHLKKTKIKLPTVISSNGEYNPDWVYMEEYIKSLPYGDKI